MDFSLIQANTDNPNITTVLYTMLMAFLLSTLLAFTYEKTTRDIDVSFNFLQSLVLASIVSATVMQAIGDSLARGLGMLGALAIIRFRTTLRKPRNMMFIFASLAVGISCGVYGFNIAVVGTLTFCLVAFLLRLTPFSDNENLVGNLRFRLPMDAPISEKEIRTLLKSTCSKHAVQKIQLGKYKNSTPKDEEGNPIESIEEPVIRQYYEYEIRLVMKRNMSKTAFLERVNSLEHLTNVRFAVNTAIEVY